MRFYILNSQINNCILCHGCGAFAYLPSFSWAFLHSRGWKIKILKLHFEWILAARFLNVIAQSLCAPRTAAHQSPLSMRISQQENVNVTGFTPWRGSKEAETMLLCFCFCSLQSFGFSQGSISKGARPTELMGWRGRTWAFFTFWQEGSRHRRAWIQLQLPDGSGSRVSIVWTVWVSWVIRK